MTDEQKQKLVAYFAEGRSVEYIIKQMRGEGVFLTPSDVLRLREEYDKEVEASLRFVGYIDWSNLLTRTLSVLDAIQDNLNPKRPDAVVTALRLVAEILKLRMTSEEERRRMEEEVMRKLRIIEERGDELKEMQRLGIVRFKEMEIHGD